MIRILLSAPHQILTVVTGYRNRRVLWMSLHWQSFPGGASGKELTCQCRRCKRHGFDPWVGKIPWRRAWQPTPVFSPRESLEQRSLAGYNPWVRKESDMAEATGHALQVTGTQSPSQGLRFISTFSRSSYATLTPPVLVCMRTRRP